MRVVVVAEFYPRAADPVLGVWAHRQALAARDAGADVEVIVLHRPVPPRSSLREPGRALAALTQPRSATLDGLPVTYVRFLAPPRKRSYGSWGAWAARPLRRALSRLHDRFPFELVHAHYAVPAADAVLRAGVEAPLVVSEHGGDVFHTAPASAAGERNVRRAFGAARLVLANSGATAARCEALGASATEVVHLGTDLPAPGRPRERSEDPVVVTVGHLIARKRHADVMRAVWQLRDRHPRLRYRIVGDGPEREALARLAGELGLGDRVELCGQLPPERAREAAWGGDVFAMPSVDEAFGVAYVEAMAGGVPAIASRGEGGPEELAALGAGLRLVPPGDVEALAAELDAILSEPVYRAELGQAARATVEAGFTWERCGGATLAAYERALGTAA